MDADSYQIVDSQYRGDTVIGYDDRLEIIGLAEDVSRVFRAAGIRDRTRVIDGRLEYQLLVPTPTQNFIISARVALPSEVGAKGKVAKKLKQVGKKVAVAAKKVAKSKAMGKLAKVIGPVAAVVPGLQGVAAGIAVAAAAKKVVMAAKKGNPKAKKLVGAVAKGARIKLAAATPKKYRVTQPTGASLTVSI
jgi:hypothetical protein